jgi:arylsulfatase
MIQRREFLRSSATALAGLAASWSAARLSLGAEGGDAAAGALPGPGVGKRPNFLVIVADDMGFSNIGCYGGEIVTPNLDALAAGGLRFTQCYSTARCWPSRTCILTGYYAQQVRMDPPKGRIPAWARVIPHYFKPLGYRCYHSGKWHLMGAPAPVKDGGFDHSYCIDDHDRFFNPKSARLDDQRLPPVPENSGFYLTTEIANRCIGFLQGHTAEHQQEPFFMYLAFTSPHFPLQAKPEDIAKYKGRYKQGWDVVRTRHWQRLREMGIVNCALPKLDTATIPSWNMPEEELRQKIGPGEVGHAVPWNELSEVQKEFQATKMEIHAAMVDRMDQEIGRVLEQLKAMGAYDNTVILFVSDNGASAEQIIRGDMNDPSAPPGSAKSYLCLGPGWSSASNSPLRLHKSWVHEGGISSPLIVHWPAGLKAKGELRNNPAHFIDIIPTALDLAGGQASEDWNGQKAPPLPGRSLVPALAKDNSVSRPYLYFHHMDNWAIRIGDWKVVAKGKDGPAELYDMATDRCESNDLAARYPERVQEMSALWKQCDQKFVEMAGPPEPLQQGGATAKAKAKGKAKAK